MTHSNANEGRTQKDARQALKLWELQTGGSSSLKEGNAYMDGYNDGWDARERRSEEDAAADAPAPASASQGDAPPESTPEQYASDYTSLYEIPSDVLASRIVGQLILQKGNLNKYKAVLQGFIENYRRDSLRSERGGQVDNITKCKHCHYPIEIRQNEWRHIGYYGAYCFKPAEPECSPAPPASGKEGLDSTSRAILRAADRMYRKDRERELDEQSNG